MDQSFFFSFVIHCTLKKIVLCLETNHQLDKVSATRKALLLSFCFYFYVIFTLINQLRRNHSERKKYVYLISIYFSPSWLVGIPLLLAISTGCYLQMTVALHCGQSWFSSQQNMNIFHLTLLLSLLLSLTLSRIPHLGDSKLLFVTFNYNTTFIFCYERPSKNNQLSLKFTECILDDRTMFVVCLL